MDEPSFGVREEPGHWLFTYDDVLRMVEAGVIAEDARVELIDGELIQLPAQLTPHAIAKSRLARVFARQLCSEREMIVDATLRFTATQVTEPDLYFYPAELRHTELTGPDLLLIVEVADSSLAYDLGRKMRLYARLGVPEYWVVNVRTRETTVHREPEGGGYRTVTPHPAEATLSAAAMPEAAVRLADLPPFE